MTTEDDACAEVGSWLRHRREEAGLSQEELAARSGLSLRTISNLERGRTRRPYPRSVRLLTGALGLPETTRPELIVRIRAGRETAAPVPIPRQLPAAAAHFAGRAAELKILDGLLEPPGSQNGTAGAVVIVAIGGIAGVGKTTLAVHWAHQVAGRFPDGQLYANLRGFDPAGTPAIPGEVIRGFLDAFQVPADRIPPGAAEQAGLYRSLLAGRRMLILLDNVRDAEQVRQLLPGASGCLVVVTSRSQLAGLAATHGARLVNLEMLSGDEPAELLARRLGPDRVTAEPQAVRELAGLCGGLPLALAITAARAAARPGFRLADLAAGLRDEGSRLDGFDAGEEAASIRAAFFWSYQSLTPQAGRLFRLLGLHPGPDISALAAASLAGLDMAQARRLLGQLTGACLITEHVPGRYSFHDLLRAYAAEQARAVEPGTGLREATGRVLDHYMHGAAAADRLLNPQRDLIDLGQPQPGTRPESFDDARQALAWFEAEHTVLLAAVALADRHGFGAYAWQLPWALATFLDRQAHWHEWEAIQHIAVAAAQRLGGKAAQAHARRGLGHVCVLLGSYSDANDQFDQALRLYRELGDRNGRPGGPTVTPPGPTGTGAATTKPSGHAEQSLRLSRAAGHRGEQARLTGRLAQRPPGNYQRALRLLPAGPRPRMGFSATALGRLTPGTASATPTPMSATTHRPSPATTPPLACSAS